ncbi:MAG: hypothetical protein IJ265_06870 [Oscillospiraceae bacterium]|nr:hypothetical protein [Oscillospiraceae bacterium]
MKMLHRISALLTAAVMGAVLFTGCMSAGPTIAEEDLPYGATMRETKTTFALPVSYDRRFLNDAQVTVLTDYFSAVQNCDGEAYAANTLDFYADYQLNEVYSEQYESMDDMMNALHASVAEATAEDFTYNMITVTDFTQERVTSGLNTMIDVLTDISGNPDFEQTLTNCWAVEMEWLLVYNGGASNVIVNEQYVYMFEIDGAYYCVM